MKRIHRQPYSDFLFFRQKPIEEFLIQHIVVLHNKLKNHFIHHTSFLHDKIGDIDSNVQKWWLSKATDIDRPKGIFIDHRNPSILSDMPQMGKYQT